MADNNELSGRVTRVVASYANVSLLDRGGLARLDVSCARRNSGSRVYDLRGILEQNARLKVRVDAMDEEAVSRVPRHLQKTVRRMYQWDVKFFRTDCEPSSQPSEHNDPLRYFEDIGNPGDLKQEHVGRVISALLQLSWMFNDFEVSKLFSLFDTHFKIPKIYSDIFFPDIYEIEFMNESELRKFIEGYPQYFAISGSKVKRCSGFSEDVFKDAITKKALQICPPDTSATEKQASEPAAATSDEHSEPQDYQDVLGRAQIIESVEECDQVLEPFLEKSKKETVVLGLDCEGVQLGRPGGCLTLVQISTWDGKAFLFDAFKNPQLLKGNSSLKELLENNSIVKVIHDCKSDTYSLYHEFMVRLSGVFDTSIAMRTIMEQVNRCRSYRIGFKALCEMLGEGASHKDDEFVKKMLETPDFWKIRPLTNEMIYYAASDALCLVPNVYLKLDGMLTPTWRHLFTWWCEDTMRGMQRAK